MSEAAARTASGASASTTADRLPPGAGGLKPVLIASLGGLFTAALVIGAISAGGGAKPAPPALESVAKHDLGYGTLSIEGSARGLSIWLIPGTKIDTLDGAQAIPVTWTPKNPC